MSLHENVAATAGFPAMVNSPAEDARLDAHTAMLEAWAARLDAAGDDVDALDRLCVELDAHGPGARVAWTAMADLANAIEDGFDALLDDHRTAARDAILAIPMPEDTDD
jgi:hypothetical protein